MLGTPPELAKKVKFRATDTDVPCRRSRLRSIAAEATIAFPPHG
jgi:hypothetical protein